MLNTISLLGCQGPALQTGHPKPTTSVNELLFFNCLAMGVAMAKWLACHPCCLWAHPCCQVRSGCRVVTGSITDGQPSLLILGQGMQMTHWRSTGLVLEMGCCPRFIRIAAERAQVFVAVPWGSFGWILTAWDKKGISKTNGGRDLMQSSSCLANVHVLAFTAFVYTVEDTV